ncbi:endolytic transglycosylase MltG [soil metagenome]
MPRPRPPHRIPSGKRKPAPPRRRSSLARLTFAFALLTIVLMSSFGFWVVTPIRSGPADPTLAAPTFEILPGSGLRGAARSASTVGVPALAFEILARVTGRAAQLKPGVYRIDTDMTPMMLLDRIVRGDAVLSSVTIVEGWTFAQMRQALSASPDLRHDASALDGPALMKAIGADGEPEGRFFPDTYKFAKGTSELVVYGRALAAMDQALAASWGQRASGLPVETPYELLKLASIVEKETGIEADRPLVAAVFVNRLKRGMLLQTDPVVIYGLGARFDGNLRRRDLTTDGPYNSYLRAGLPPTPICLPGRAAIAAAANPPASPALYFVSRGDGSSHFSQTLEEHNRAVDRFQRKLP